MIDAGNTAWLITATALVLFMTLPGLIVGAFVERMRFGAVLLFTVLWLLLVYVPVAHWIWGGGWLAQKGVLDFAGGLLGDLTAGVSAPGLAVLLGSRPGFP